MLCKLRQFKRPRRSTARLPELVRKFFLVNLCWCVIYFLQDTNTWSYFFFFCQGQTGYYAPGASSTLPAPGGPTLPLGLSYAPSASQSLLPGLQSFNSQVVDCLVFNLLIFSMACERKIWCVCCSWVSSFDLRRPPTCPKVAMLAVWRPTLEQTRRSRFRISMTFWIQRFRVVSYSL